MSKKDVIKAFRKGSRDAELEDECGWTAMNKIHPNRKKYTRKTKHKLRED
jgi:hypothetical protein